MRRRPRIFAVSLAVFLCTLSPVSAPAADNAGVTFEQRAAAEKASRSRYRDLEVGSLIFILLAGGGIVFWAIRRK